MKGSSEQSVNYEFCMEFVPLAVPSLRLWFGHSLNEGEYL